jgi:hypothetical protein
MKLTFFLIAFFLILFRVYFSWAGHRGHSNDEGNILIKGDNYIEEIHWSGKVRLSDDEKTIGSISPGGYLKLRENDRKLEAESNLQGEVSYMLYDGHENLSLNDSGRRFIAVALQKMIARGFNAEGRAERIYKKGGNQALLEEIPRIEIDYARGPYIDLLLKSDSLTKDQLIVLLKQINDWGSDVEKRNCLGRFTADRLKDSTLARVWLGAVDHLGADVEKQHLLGRFIDQGRVDGQGRVDRTTYDSLLTIIGHIGADVEKRYLYEKLINDSLNTNDQWISLIQATTKLGADIEKVNLLVQIAPKMPKEEPVRAEFLKAAKSIGSDADYGRVMRAVE